jgi:hypothetical protein
MMTKLCQRCGDHPVADEGPPSFPFCEACWPEVSVGKYYVDEDGNFIGFMTEADEAMGFEAAADYAEHMVAEWLADEATAPARGRSPTAPDDEVAF